MGSAGMRRRVKHLFPQLLLLALATGLLVAQEERSRIRRPRLRVRPDEGRVEQEAEEELDSLKEARQLRDRDKSRSRIRRPSRPQSRPDSDTDFEDSFPSRFSPGRQRDDETERPRFVPSRGSNTFDRDPDRFRASPGSSSNSINSISSQRNGGYKLVCYYTNWSQYRPTIGKFLPEYIDPFMCTHLIFAFGWLKNGKLSTFEENDDTVGGKVGLYDRVVGLKAKNPNLKVLLAIGGWSFGTAKFKEVAKTRFSRQTFVFSAVEFLREHNFDGLDMDWEYPKSSDKENFSALLSELRQAFDYEAEDSGKEALLLSAAVPVGPDNVRGGYDVPAVAKALDFVNLMAYDFHGKWESQAGHNAPLYAPSSDSEWRKQLSVEFAAKMWTRLGTPKEKLVIGMPTYGRSFTLSNPSQYVVNSPSKGGGTAGEYTREAGFLSYYEVCDMLLNGSNYIWDNEMKVPYLVKGNQWVGFDDERSIRNKMDWVKDNGYAGAMVWTVDMDDFNGTVCGSGVKYPLIGAMREELFGTSRDVVAPGIEPADIDWAAVTAHFNPIAATTLPPANKIDIQNLLRQSVSDNKRVLPALLQKLPDN